VTLVRFTSIRSKVPVLATKFLGLLFATTMASVVAIGCSSQPMQEPTGASEDNLLAGTVLTPAQVAGHLRAAGFPENMIGKMVCTAKYESSFYERAQNGSYRGLFQIGTMHVGESGCPTSAEDLYDGLENAKCALSVYKRQGLGAWSAYTSHRSECDAYVAPASPGGSTASDDNPPAKDDPSADDADPSESDDGPGCWSPTLRKTVEEGACVQSASSGRWFRCDAGNWLDFERGTQADDECTSSHPLE
jgi:hypothetical protein